MKGLHLETDGPANPAILVKIAGGFYLNGDGATTCNRSVIDVRILAGRTVGLTAAAPALDQ
jgi:hypothetical protein